MQDIIIDEEIKRILPALDETAYNNLEMSILAYGCLMPLVLVKHHPRRKWISSQEKPVSAENC